MDDFATTIYTRKLLDSLKGLRVKKSWKSLVMKQSYDLDEFYYQFVHWKVQLPNFRDVFRQEEMDRLLSDSIKYLERRPIRGQFIVDFVARSGYKDEPKVDEKDKHPKLRRTTAVHLAGRLEPSSYFGHVIRQLFTIYDNFHVNYTDSKSGVTHFHVACGSGLVDVAEKFLELGQDPNCLVNVNTVDPPLILALEQRHKRLAELLLRKGANVNLANAKGRTPLHVVCQINKDDYFVETFFRIVDEERQTLLVNAKDKQGCTALHWAALHDNNRAIELLLMRGAYPNLADVKGVTPLHLLCKGKRRDDDLARRFFELGRTVRVDVQDSMRDTPLHLADLANGHKTMVELLLRRGTHPNLANSKNATPLDICLGNVDEDLVRTFFEADQAMARVYVWRGLAQTALRWAVTNLKPLALDVLLHRGADLSGFVFPTGRDFAAGCESCAGLKLFLASRILACVEILESGGYELDQRGALTIMDLFSKHELFEQSGVDLEERLRTQADFARAARRVTIGPTRLSLHDLISLRLEEAAAAEQRLAYSNCLQLQVELPIMLPRDYGRLCIAHLCEKMSRGFFQRWALHPFWKLIHYRLPHALLRNDRRPAE